MTNLEQLNRIEDKIDTILKYVKFIHDFDLKELKEEKRGGND
jgi:hypothetical protein